jgi:hypothetical protein
MYIPIYGFLGSSQAIARKFFKCICSINQAMVKKVSLNISDDSYQRLASLGDFYKRDIKKAIVDILDVVGHESQWIINLGKEYKVPVKLNTVMAHMLDASHTSIYSLFNEILERLEVKGLYVLEDLDIDLDKNYMFFSYTALRGCDLRIEEFHITLDPGLKTLTTTSYIEVKKVNKQVLGKLKELVQSVEVSEELGELSDLEDYNIKIEEGEEFWYLKIECTGESLDCLPSVSKVSKFVERVFKEAGIEHTRKSKTN